MESKRRSLVKALSWRFFAVLITTSVAFAITGEWVFALEIGALDTTIKIGAYYMHERMWLRSSYGVDKESKDYQI